jgi:hypothetical protein
VSEYNHVKQVTTTSSHARHKRVTDAAQARAIAREAYIYGFPLVDNYRVVYSYFVDRKHPEYKGPWNQISNVARVYTPEDRTIQTPNSDTPYSSVGADLRAEPLVLTVPPIEKGRYFSLQFIDLYTFNFAYVGSRTTGNGGGSYVLAGPGWRDKAPKGVSSVIRCETELAFVVYRTQLFGPDDIENVKRIQAGYQVQALSAFLGRPAPPAAPKIDFLRPIGPDQERKSLHFFDVLNFVLQFCPTHRSERALMARFAKLGVGPGERFDAVALPPETRKAIEEGMADAWRDYEVMERRMATGERTSGDLFGTREYLKNNYLFRMTAAVDGIYGNSKAEAIYPGYLVDAAGQKLDASRSRYTLRFAPNQLPPVNAFWSLTMYESPSRLLVANPLGRYLINSAMLPQLARDADGGLTLHVQHDSPGKGRESNWLPAPDGPFIMALRLYRPKPDALSGHWKKPPLERASDRVRSTGEASS